jgi:hypothetical protein
MQSFRIDPFAESSPFESPFQLESLLVGGTDAGTELLASPDVAFEAWAQPANAIATETAWLSETPFSETLLAEELDYESQPDFPTEYETDDEALFEQEDPVARSEWDGATRELQHHFDGGFAGYVQMKPLYAAAGVANPMQWIRDNIVTVRFFDRRTPGHRRLIAPVQAAEAELKAQGVTPALTKFWSFVPRAILGGKISKHSAGLAIDINHPTNPHIKSPSDILVIRALTGVDLGAPASDAAMRQASESFKQRFTAQWIAQQTGPVAEAIRARRGILNRYAQTGFFNLEQSLVDAFIRAGFGWGGRWRTHKDFMHFELPWAASPGAATSSTPAPAAAQNVDRVVGLNRRYGASLGWQPHFDRIVALVGITDQSPGPTEFSEAVARWQRTQGLQADGVIGPNTWTRMRALLGG